jgi:hypothetical protein
MLLNVNYKLGHKMWGVNISRRVLKVFITN